MPQTRAAKKTGKRTAATVPASKVFSDEERAAMRDYIQEKRRAASGKGDEEGAVLEKIATMSGSDRAMAERLHSLIKATAPTLAARLWYGMPAYTLDGKVVCFFQDAHKFKTRYATLGFSDKANLDEGSMWPTAYALKQLTGAEEAKIRALVKKAVG